MKRLMMMTILMLATTSNFSWAQAPANHDAHHPPQATSPGPAQPAPPPGQPGMGGMPMMNMMSGMMNDMSMMNMMETMRAELKITDAQTGVWNAFAETLRANAKKLGEMRSSMMPQAGAGQQKAPTIIERVKSQERWMQTRLEGTRTMKTSLSKLYESLSDDQKKSANELLAPHMGMGMMTMMRAQMGPGPMRPGQMGSDPH